MAVGTVAGLFAAKCLSTKLRVSLKNCHLYGKRAIPVISLMCCMQQTDSEWSE